MRHLLVEKIFDAQLAFKIADDLFLLNFFLFAHRPFFAQLAFKIADDLFCSSALFATLM